MKDLLEKQNALIDARDVAESIGREFVEADLVQYEEHGIDLHTAAEYFTETYRGTNRFMTNVLVKRLKSYGKLTQGQARAALSIMRQEHLGIERPRNVEPERKLECYTCHAEFSTWDELNAHKSQEHGRKETAPAVFTDKGEAADVLEVTTATKGLDLSNLPDGRYCVANMSNMKDPTSNPNVFLQVRRVQRTHKEDRRYKWGKIVTGNEIVVAGTIEVRLWSSDSREWIGQQKPGDVYRGKAEEELELIMMMPETCAIMFGRLMGYCGRCGKELTDKVSREIGLGLDCEKHIAKRGFTVDYTYLGADRPNPAKANPHDADYLSGKLTRWIEPKVNITGGTTPDDEADEEEAP